MEVADLLLRTAYEDTQVLITNDSLGDNLSIRRGTQEKVTRSPGRRAEKGMDACFGSE
jgi:hypothetical protein